MTVAQIQSLARANDPIYEIGFRIVGSTQQERIWTHVLKSLAAYFGVNEPVTLEKTLLDTRLQWSQAKNVWYNAGARSMVYTIIGLGASYAQPSATPAFPMTGVDRMTNWRPDT
jgi:hypothetical protein